MLTIARKRKRMESGRRSAWTNEVSLLYWLERTEYEFLCRCQHVQTECDLVLVAFALDPA